MIRRARRARLGSALFQAFAIASLSGATSCDRHAHGARRGTLADVAKPDLVVQVVDGKPVIAISNTAADNACLTLDNLTAKIDGAPQTLIFAGGRDDGTTKGHVGPVDKSDFCSYARFDVWRPVDFSRKTNVVEISDSSATLRAEFPNIFVTPIWVTPPPTWSHPGLSFHAVIAPPPTAGTAQYDAENFLVGSVKVTKKSDDTKVKVRPGPDGAIDVDLPSTLAPDTYVFYLASSERGIAAISCGFASCVAANEFVLTAPLDVWPWPAVERHD